MQPILANQNGNATRCTRAPPSLQQASFRLCQQLSVLELAVENYERLMSQADAYVAAPDASLAQFEAGYPLGEVLIRDFLMARRSALYAQKNRSEYRNARDRAALEQIVLKLP